MFDKYDITAVVLEIWMAPGWTMKRYRSMAIKRVENEERKTQVAWCSKLNNMTNSWKHKLNQILECLFVELIPKRDVAHMGNIPKKFFFSCDEPNTM